MLKTSRKAQLGLNLVELMIGLVVGLIVLAAISTVYLNTARGSRDTLNANRLNQDLRAVMDIMVADIRRAGYSGAAAPGASPNPFTVRSTTAGTDIYVSNVGVNSDCILYTYDATYNTGNIAGTVDAADYFGFRRRVDATTGNGVIAALTPTNTGADCSALSGEALNDPAVINISVLSITTGRPSAGEPGSKCVDATSGMAWEVESMTTQVPACVCTDTTICPAYPTAPPPASGDVLEENRQITISITANHVSDTTLTRTLTESVLVRNNRIFTVP